MAPIQIRKLYTWLGLYVLLPLGVYPLAAVFTLSRGVPLAKSFTAILATGDLVLYSGLLYSTTIEATMIAFLRSRPEEEPSQFVPHVLFLGMLIGGFHCFLFYGLTLGDRLAKAAPDEAVIAWVSAVATATAVLICGTQYFCLLRTNQL